MALEKEGEVHIRLELLIRILENIGGLLPPGPHKEKLAEFIEALEVRGPVKIVATIPAAVWRRVDPITGSCDDSPPRSRSGSVRRAKDR
jgi:hypothetical protein